MPGESSAVTTAGESTANVDGTSTGGTTEDPSSTGQSLPSGSTDATSATKEVKGNTSGNASAANSAKVGSVAVDPSAVSTGSESFAGIILVIMIAFTAAVYFSRRSRE